MYILVMPAAFTCFAACTIGLETLLLAELRALAGTGGIGELSEAEGGIEFTADLAALYAANLHLRTASRVVARLGSFHASAFHELERRARKLPWQRFVAPGSALAFRVACRKSRLYHEDAIAQRLFAAAAERVQGVSPAHAGEEDGPAVAAVAQLITVRLFRDYCTVSVDSSGELLHRRGYRLATAKAPLRETLAAAMLLGTGWNGSAPLLDPMCGSGTIPIEAALLARGIPPGLRRAFAFEGWPGFDGAAWGRVKDEAAERVLPHAPAPIVGSDRDEGAVAAARANAARAGVAGDVEFRRAAISAIQPPPQPGWLVTNPPYGLRVGERRALRDLFAVLGNVARRRCPGWRLAFFSANVELERQTGIPLERRLETLNGGLRVRLVQGTVPVTASASA